MKTQKTTAFEQHLNVLEYLLRGARHLDLEVANDIFQGVKARNKNVILQCMAFIPNTSLIVANVGSSNEKYRLVPKWVRGQRPMLTVDKVRFVLVQDDGLGCCTYCTPEQADIVFDYIEDETTDFYLCLNDMMYDPMDFEKPEKGKKR